MSANFLTKRRVFYFGIMMSKYLETENKPNKFDFA